MKNSIKYFAALVGLVFCAAAQAEVKTREVAYQAGEVQAKGFLAWDDAVAGKRPGILVVPEWWGLNDYARMRAKMLAKLGYVALAADVYGNGQSTSDPKQAGAWSGALKAGDRAQLRTRVEAALAELKKNPDVDGRRTAAIGYCFGGTAVLELARAGGDVKAVVAFHPDPGAGSAPAPARLKPKILACIGAIDPFVSEAAITAFKKEMQAAHADWELNFYGNAVHAFSNPDADKYGIQGIAYNKGADHRSWQAMLDLFNSVFGEPTAAPGKGHQS